MTTINNHELDEALLYVISRCRVDQPFFAKYYDALYHLGIRATEALMPSIWSFPSENTVVLQPHKGNNMRFFLRSDMPVDFLYSLEFPEFVEVVPSYSQLNYLFSIYMYYGKIFIGKKSSTLHLFRHNYVKKLKSSGLTDIEIQNKIGEKELSSAEQYIYSTYYVNI